jgi:hypothetical protein
MLQTSVHHGVAITGIIAHINGGRIIEAIKSYRVLNGVGLKEAKDACEAIREALGIKPHYAPQPKEQYAVISQYDGENDYNFFYEDTLSLANESASAIVNNRNFVMVAKVISKSVSVATRTMKAI